MPTQWNSAPAAMTTSASRSLIPWSTTTLGSTPRRNSRRASRSAMFTTIWTWTHEWSDIPRRRVALTALRCHQALTWSSALTASSSASSLRFPRVGTRIRTSAIASRGGRLRRASVSTSPGGLGLAPRRCPSMSSRWTLRGSGPCGVRRRHEPSARGPRRSSRPRSSARACPAGHRAARDPRPARQLHARVEIARHQVGRADVDDRLVAVALEREDARVLEEAADDRVHPDVLRDALDPGLRQQIPRTLRSTRTPACEAR